MDNSILITGAAGRSDLISKICKELETCNLCTTTFVIELPDGMWSYDIPDIIDMLMPEIEANLKRNGGFMIDGSNFTFTGGGLHNLRSRFVTK